MHSKTSCFKGILIKKAVLRFWPAWALYLIVLFFAVVMPVYNSIPDEEQIDVFGYAFGYLEAGYYPVIIFCFAALFALLVFSWLYTARSCNMMHAFPYTRVQLFASHYLAGFCFLAVPQGIIFLAVMPGCMEAGVVPAIILKCYLFALACDFIFFTIAVLCCMLAGHLLSALVYYLIFNSVVVIVRILIKGIYANYGYGLVGDSVVSTGPGDFLAPIIYITTRCTVSFDREERSLAAAVSSVRIEGLPALLCFCAVAVLVLFFAIYLYKIRQVECAGEMSAFRPVNPVIRWIVTFCCGIATGVFLTETLFDTGYTPETFPQMIVLTIVFTLVWYLISEMVLKKSFRIFRPAVWAEWGVLCALILVLLGGVKADMFHVVRHVPQQSEVRAMLVEGNYSIVVQDPDEIEKGIRLQERFLENRVRYEKARQEYYGNNGQNTQDGSLYMQPVSITYFLDDESTLRRFYYLPVSRDELQDPESAINVLTELETPESALQTMLGKDYDAIQFTDVIFDDRELEADAAQELFDALKQDLLDGNIHYQTKDQLDREFREDCWLDDSIGISLAGEAAGYYNNGISGILGESDRPAAEQGYVSEFEDNYYAGGYYYLYGGENISHGETIHLKNANKTEISIDFWINEHCENACRILEQYGAISGPSDLSEMVSAYLDAMYASNGDYSRG